MRILRLLFILAMISIYACKQEKKNIYRIDRLVIDASFEAARLNKIRMIGKNQYVGDILPESEPINKSPWFAFSIWSEEKKKIELKLNYGIYKHRYIPKLSIDRLHWKPIEKSQIEIDTINGTATLLLEVSSQKLYVAAQEIETSQDTYDWINHLQNTTTGIKNKIAGKTVQNNNNYVLLSEKEGVNNSIILIARQHPPEIPGGTIGFKSFCETVFSESEIAKEYRNNFNTYVFPLLNPDGVDMGNWRHNANGKDLNRDWINFTQPETKTVKNFINTKVKEGKKIRFAIDFHTSYSGPYLLILDSINESKTSKIIPDWIQSIEATSDFDVTPKRRSQELPYCYNYFYNAYGTEAVTYEDGDEVNREMIKEKARIYARELMRTLINQQKNGMFKN